MYLPRRRTAVIRAATVSRQSGAIDQSGQAQALATCPHRRDGRTQQARPQGAHDGLDFGQLGHGLLLPFQPGIAAQRTECVCQARELRH